MCWWCCGSSYRFNIRRNRCSSFPSDFFFIFSFSYPRITDMEADDPRLADEYVNEFVLDHLDVSAVKREIQSSDYHHHHHQQSQHQEDKHPNHHAHHQHHHGSSRSAGAGGRLPSMPITSAGTVGSIAAATAAVQAAATLVQSPPPHYLLTPPGCEQEYPTSHHQSHRHNNGHVQVSSSGGGNMVIHGHTEAVIATYADGVLITGAAAAVKVQSSAVANSSMMYPSTPGTPPDTPPVSSSPPPATPIRQPAFSEEMVWLTQSLRLGQEPLDLRPTNYSASEVMQHHHHQQQQQHQQHHHLHQHHNHNNHHQEPTGSAVEWNMTQHQHVTVIQPSLSSAAGGKAQSFGRPHYDMSPSTNGGSGLMVHHFHQQHHQSQQHRPLSVSSSSVMSPMSSRCGGGSSDDLINDALLLQLPVRDLNKRLQGISKEEVARLKQKRRTLKNRGYAQSCRTKRMNQRIELENANQALISELQKMKTELSRVAKERDLYKQRCSTLAAARESMNAAAVFRAAAASTPLSVSSVQQVDSSSNSPEIYLWQTRRSYASTLWISKWVIKLLSY